MQEVVFAFNDIPSHYLAASRPVVSVEHQSPLADQSIKLPSTICDTNHTREVGDLRVVEIVAVDAPLSEVGLVWLVASAQQPSAHALAQATVKYAKECGLKLAEPTSFEAIPGHGLRATVDERTILVGNRKLMRDCDIALDGLGEQLRRLEDGRWTLIYAAVDGLVAGIIVVARAPRPGT